MCEPWQPTESEMQAIIKDLEKRLQIKPCPSNDSKNRANAKE